MEDIKAINRLPVGCQGEVELEVSASFWLETVVSQCGLPRREMQRSNRNE